MSELLKKYGKDEEIAIESRRIASVKDDHQLISSLCDILHSSMEVIVAKIVDIIKDSKEWEQYISPIVQWINQNANSCL